MRISDWSSDVCSSDLPKPLIACSKQLTCCLGSNVYKIMGFPTLRRRPHKLPAHTVKDHSSTRKLPPQLAAQSISPQRAAHLTPLSSSVNTLNLPLHTSPPPPTDRKSTRLNSSHSCATRMPSSA